MKVMFVSTIKSELARVQRQDLNFCNGVDNLKVKSANIMKFGPT
jgi:hypothetical protein